MGLKETFYISHGSPTLAIDNEIPARHFLKSWREKSFCETPKSILVISAHWDTNVPSVNVVEKNDTIHDFSGFPKTMYQIEYAAPGAPKLAMAVIQLLQKSGFKPVRAVEGRGLDHGAWVPLMLMYPDCDIPVCQLSIQSKQDGTYHYNLGRALAPLKEEGVLIVGSGATTHNLSSLRFAAGPAVPWAAEFDGWLKSALLGGRYGEVNHFYEHAPHSKKAHPSPDHIYPLHVAMGAAGECSHASLIHHSWGLGTLSYASYSFAAN